MLVGPFACCSCHNVSIAGPRKLRWAAGRFCSRHDAREHPPRLAARAPRDGCEALIKRGENVVGVYVAPGKEGAKGRPGQGGGACRQAARYRPDSQKNRRYGTTCSTASVSLPIRVQRLFAAGDQFSKTKSRSSVGGVSAICGSYHIETCRTLPTAYVKYDV